MVLIKQPLSMGVVVCILVTLLSACSNTLQSTSHSATPNQNKSSVDPYESINRKVFAFNNALDQSFLKPIAKVYKVITPKPVDETIGNVFANFDDVGNILNNTLQGNIDAAAEDMGRLLFNSTLGLGGMLDVASAAGFKKSDEDFGQTLAKWGVKSGPYVMLPLLGPSTLRDASAKLSVDRITDPTHYHKESLGFTVVDVIKKRSSLFGREAVLKDLSDDKYSALRDIWLQNREFLIRNGQSDTSTETDLIDELESLDDN